MLLIPIVLSFILVLFNIVSDRNNRYVYWLLVSIAAFASGSRINVGRDFPVYLSFFQGEVPVSGTEPFFILLAHSLSVADSSGRLGFLFCSTVTLFGYAFFLSKMAYKYRFFCFHLFLTIPLFYINSLNLVRQHMALALGLVGLSMLLSSKKTRAALVVLISVGIHTSAAALLLLILPARRFENYLIALLPFLALIFLFTSIGFEKDIIIGTGYSYFLNHSSSNSKILFGGFGFVAFFISGLLLFHRNITYRMPILIGNFCVAILIFAWIFSDIGNLWLRVAQIFFIFVVIGFTVCVGAWQSIVIKKLIFTALSSLLLMLFLLKYYQDPSFGYI